MSELLRDVADIIEPHIAGRWKVRERAEGAAMDLFGAGLLTASGGPERRERVAAVLQCRFGWATAEQIADELAATGLLAGRAVLDAHGSQP